MKNSLRLVDFEIRAEIVKEAVARVRETAKSRPPISRKVIWTRESAGVAEGLVRIEELDDSFEMSWQRRDFEATHVMIMIIIIHQIAKSILGFCHLS